LRGAGGAAALLQIEERIREKGERGAREFDKAWLYSRSLDERVEMVEESHINTDVTAKGALI